jgi:hypothetical protein
MSWNLYIDRRDKSVRGLFVDRAFAEKWCHKKNSYLAIALERLTPKLYQNVYLA